MTGAGLTLPGAVMVASRTGGQGKTALAMAIEALHRLRGAAPTVYAIDTGGSATVSKIGGFLPGVVEIRISADLSDVVREGSAALQHWDRVGEALCSPLAVIDVGANVIPAITEWGRFAHAGDMTRGRGNVLIVPVRDSEISVTDAIAVVTDVRAAEETGGLAFDRIVLALVMIGPGEDICSNSSRGRLERLGLPMIRIERELEMLRYLELARKPFAWAYRLSIAEAMAAFPVDIQYKATAWRNIGDFCRWLEAIDMELVRIGVFPSRLPARLDYWEPLAA